MSMPHFDAARRCLVVYALNRHTQSYEVEIRPLQIQVSERVFIQVLSFQSTAGGFIIVSNIIQFLLVAFLYLYQEEVRKIVKFLDK